jgi:hypothetical protein
MARTYVDAMGAMRAWMNSRTDTLVGPDKPLWLGAHLKVLGAGEPKAYAYLEENFSTRSLDSGENPDMLASLSAQVYGNTREAATIAAVALAEELSTELEGRETPVPDAGAILYAVDDITGPSWTPDGDRPRLVVTWTVRARPA